MWWHGFLKVVLMQSQCGAGKVEMEEIGDRSGVTLENWHYAKLQSRRQKRSWRELEELGEDPKT